MMALLCRASECNFRRQKLAVLPLTLFAMVVQIDLRAPTPWNICCGSVEQSMSKNAFFCQYSWDPFIRLGGAMPLALGTCGTDCTTYAICTASCRFESSRRNYQELWSSLEALSLQQQEQQQQQHQQQEQQSLGIGASNSQAEVAGAGMPHTVVPRVNVMGNGHLANLSLPAALRGHVHVYGNLSFADYYDTICRCATPEPAALLCLYQLLHAGHAWAAAYSQVWLVVA